eukprot:jgi/Astpho2/5862/Aster-02364
MTGQGSSPKIDPSQIPRPADRVTSRETEEFETRQDGHHAVPPSAQTRFIVRDTGDASPRNMRCTMHAMPTTPDLLKQAATPLAVIWQPFAVGHPQDDQIPVVDFGESGPLRCPHCKAYVNPHLKWEADGRTFLCNFCLKSSPTPSDYICNTGPDGRRHDAHERPELSRGGVDFAVAQGYMVRPPMPPTYLFLIDVSYPAVSSGLTSAACAAILRVLDDIQGGKRAHVGIATFDATVHYYSLRPSQSQAHMLVIPDAAEPYSPLPESVVVPLHSSRSMVEDLLNSIPSLFEGNQVQENCMAAATQAAVQTLKARWGGKVLVFMSSLPKLGAHALTLAGASVQKGDDYAAQTIMQPASKDYAALAGEAAEHQVCIDLFVMARQSCDLATLGALCKGTGGQLCHYFPWDGMEALARLRCSRGLSVAGYFGSFHRRGPIDIDLPSINSDQSIAVQLRLDEKLQEGVEAYLQLALLYTSTSGQRLVRVHTMGIPITANIAQMFLMSDQDAQVNFLARMAASQIPTAPLSVCRDQISRGCINTLFAYRKHCTTSPATGQLILPQALKLLPAFSLGMYKSPCFRSDVSPDTRSAWVTRFLTMSLSTGLAMVFPRLLPLHQMLTPEAAADEDQAPDIPEGLPLSTAKLHEDGVYLFENGFEALIFIQRKAPPQLLRALF